jgi:hypothetical protein
VNALRTIYRYWLWLMVLAVIVQIGFAGIGAFGALDQATAGSVDEDAYYDEFTLHAALGTFLVLGGLLTFLLALAARVGRQRVLHALGLFVLLVVQMILGWSGQELPEVLGFLHPINALLILGAAFSLAAREWRGDRMMGRGAPETMAPPPSAAA